MIPFGFRQDVEDPKPEPEGEDQRKEVNNTSISAERAWAPTARTPASPRLSASN